MSEIAEIIRMYPGQTHLFKTSDSTYHLTEAGARLQARHLPSKTIEKITCKTGKVTILKS